MTAGSLGFVQSCYAENTSLEEGRISRIGPEYPCSPTTLHRNFDKPICSLRRQSLDLQRRHSVSVIAYYSVVKQYLTSLRSGTKVLDDLKEQIEKDRETDERFAQRLFYHETPGVPYSRLELSILWHHSYSG